MTWLLIRPRLESCKCGCTKIDFKTCYIGKKKYASFRCRECGFSTGGKNKRDAMARWNRMAEKRKNRNKQENRKIIKKGEQ